MSKRTAVDPLLSGYRTSKARLALAEQRLRRLRRDETAKIREAETDKREALAAIRDAETAAQGLPSKEKRVLEVLFFENHEFPFDALCDEMCCEERTVYRVRMAALRHFSEIAGGQADSST